jgi:voltage-gated potassium channel
MQTLRDRARIVIFEAETPAGRTFDVVLIVCILASVGVVFLDSVPAIHRAYARTLYGIEWFFTILFTVEYAARLWCVERPLRYARSFYGVVDLLGTLPTYLSLFVPGTQFLLVIRILRVLRVFRVLRLLRYVGEADVLIEALRSSRRKVTVFLFTVLSLVVVTGSIMYLVEGEANGFTSIPISMYWAVVTVTTVGYGDISPVTPLGRLIASALMILGYAIIAVPTGIFSVQLSEAMRKRQNTRACARCAAEGHSGEASFCWRCGSPLHPEEG